MGTRRCFRFPFPSAIPPIFRLSLPFPFYVQSVGNKPASFMPVCTTHRSSCIIQFQHFFSQLLHYHGSDYSPDCLFSSFETRFLVDVTDSMGSFQNNVYSVLCSHPSSKLVLKNSSKSLFCIQSIVSLSLVYIHSSHSFPFSFCSFLIR